MQQLIIWALRLYNVRLLQYSPDDASEAKSDLWPHADEARKRRAELFATYVKRRLEWGVRNLIYSYSPEDRQVGG